jgi:hypothetical protein
LRRKVYELGTVFQPRDLAWPRLVAVHCNGPDGGVNIG